MAKKSKLYKYSIKALQILYQKNNCIDYFPSNLFTINDCREGRICSSNNLAKATIQKYILFLSSDSILQSRFSHLQASKSAYSAHTDTHYILSKWNFIHP